MGRVDKEERAGTDEARNKVWRRTEEWERHGRGTERVLNSPQSRIRVPE